MPNLDGGHYFLTTLAPIKVGAEQRSGPDGAPPDTSGGHVAMASHVELVQVALQQMPTAMQSPATEESGNQSPFAQSLKTHLCRFVVIEDTIYNGRNGSDAILVTLGLRPDPQEPQHIDHLPCPYLFFSADIDAVMEPGDPLPDTLTVDEQNAIRDRYAQDLWNNSADELKSIYRHCQDFDADSMTAEGFAAYLARCQIDTWMPFNDYYTKPEELGALPQLPLSKIKKAVAVPAGLAALCLVLGLVDSLLEAVFGMSLVPGWVWLGVPVFALVAWLAIKWAYGLMISMGQTSWPAGQYGSLPAVLKGLYTQQHFADFVVANQASDPKKLHAAFGKFLKDRDPSNLLDKTKTQSPGVISSK